MKKRSMALGGLIAMLFLMGLGTVAAFYLCIIKNMPEYASIGAYHAALSTGRSARYAVAMEQAYNEKRLPLTFEDIPEKLRLAFLVMEDAAFYRRGSFDPVVSALRFVVCSPSEGAQQGVSTITQQLAKWLIMTWERQDKRRVQEVVLAYRLEKHLSKDEILTLYLNHVFLGSRSFGVQAAARTYFGKHVNALNLAECAFLAGLAQAPSRYNPYRNPVEAKKRQEYVLVRLQEYCWITEAEYDQALAQPLVYHALGKRI